MIGFAVVRLFGCLVVSLFGCVVGGCLVVGLFDCLVVVSVGCLVDLVGLVIWLFVCLVLLSFAMFICCNLFGCFWLLFGRFCFWCFVLCCFVVWWLCGCLVHCLCVGMFCWLIS